MLFKNRTYIAIFIYIGLLGLKLSAYPMSGYIGWAYSYFDLKLERNITEDRSVLLENKNCGIHRFLRFSDIFFVQEEDYSKKYGEIDKDITFMYNCLCIKP